MNTALIDVGLGFSPRNAEGYPDPTAYKAMKKLQRADYGYRPLVYICSPYSGDVETNVELARAFCAHAVTRCSIPLAPHLLFPQFMDDTNPDERELAMFFNRVLLSKCEAIWVYTARVSAGMRVEIEWAHHLEMPIKYFDADFEEVTL
ncbi:TPA: DUF4406 domain-containing protein [Corynebacterium striatum]|nr:DUF4406 domain-containing protein [Corynebacterium striatum]HAT1197423.1 DUF4406 domain-containing protein [Corynebacterium striatum]HAT1275997.1 DUF4406 domain-containing protein [Corynebacterium striatum]HAT1291165.1 DUF4406 domain-containing protein [Corynebacterium striatum]HAT1311685.1 DUF4406 domain-containing protein [Corynebacterium striatum]